MENRELILEYYCNNFNFLMVRLALKTPKQNFSELMLQNVAKVTTLNLKIVSKLTGINRDRCDWYCIEVSGTFDDLSLAIACWKELGIKEYLAISSS